MKQVMIPPELMRKVAEGDKQAFEQLYYLTYKPVFSFLLSLTMNREDAGDLLQETYLRVYGSAHLYRDGNPMAWIMKIAKNLFLMDKRKKSARPESGGDTQQLAADDFSSIEDAETRILLEQLFEKLTQEEREIIVLHITGGFRHREIAKILDVPLGTVLSKYSRALKKLKASASEAMEGTDNVG